MQTLKRFLLSGALVLIGGLLVLPAAFAQGRMGNPEQMKARMMEEADDTVKQLGLTDEAAKTVKEILAKRVEKRSELLATVREQRSREAMEAMRTQMSVVDEETAKELAGVLSEAQLDKYKKIEEERRSQRRGPRGN